MPQSANAILSGDYWGGSAGTPTVVTYSFDASPNYDTQSGFGYSDDYINSFLPFSRSQVAASRDAFDAWSDASGLTFTEVASGQGDIRLGNYDFDYNSQFSQGAYAFLPTGSLPISGDVFMDYGEGFKDSFYLHSHEIGHALGFEHPHDGDYDVDETVMTTDYGPTDELGSLDITAAQHAYGSPSQSPSAGNGLAPDPVGNAELITGTGQDDAISGDANSERLRGGSGDDTLAGSDGRDNVRGGEGSDLIGGGYGADTIEGLAGNDIIGSGRGDDRAFGGAGEDVVNGGPGDDQLRGGTGNDTMGASYADDTVIGDGGADSLGGGSGRDVLNGGTQNDSIGGGEGNDTVFGARGDDFLAGGGRNDEIFGSFGDDRINGGAGNDWMSGGRGNDTFVFNFFEAGATDTISDFTPGQDHLFFRGIDGMSDVGMSGGGDALLEVEGQDIRLEGVSPSELSNEDFLFY